MESLAFWSGIVAAGSRSPWATTGLSCSMVNNIRKWLYSALVQCVNGVQHFSRSINSCRHFVQQQHTIYGKLWGKVKYIPHFWAKRANLFFYIYSPYKSKVLGSQHSNSCTTEQPPFINLKCQMWLKSKQVNQISHHSSWKGILLIESTSSWDEWARSYLCLWIPYYYWACLSLNNGVTKTTGLIK